MKEDRFKFRVWMRGLMCYGPALKDGNLGLDIDYVVMQCTGLKDKNGKLIYEGDIVKDLAADKRRYYGDAVPAGDLLYQIRWHICQWLGYSIERLTESPPRRPIIDVLHGTELYGEMAEVVGNIYENPEKLEGQ